MKKLIIAVDVDETVCDMLGGICAREEKWDRNTKRVVLAEDRTGWDLPRWMYQHFDTELYETWARPIQGARTAVDQLREMGHRVLFVTSCVRGTADAKMDWLVRYGFLPRGQKTLHDFVAAKDKSMIRADVLIDDAVHNVEPFPGHAFLITQPHNRDEECSRPRLASIVEAPEAIRQLTEEDDNVELIEALIPVARSLARGNRNGITVSDIRKAGLAQGILTGDETGTQLSALGHVMRKAGLVNVGSTRRSDLEVTHGVHQVVWFEDLSLAAA